MIDVLEKLERLEALINKGYILNKEFLTFEEGAEYLKLSKSALYKLTSNKEIPYYVPGGKIIYFKREDLDKWVLQGKVPAMQELQGEVTNYLLNNRKS